MTRNPLIERPVPFSDTGIIFAGLPAQTVLPRLPRYARNDKAELLSGETAVNHQLGSCYVRYFVAGQEQHVVGNLSRRPVRFIGMFAVMAHTELAEPPAMGGIGPGYTELTRIPASAQRTAADLVINRTAPLDAL